MLPKSYLGWKWTVYGLATLLLFALQHLLLDHVRLWGAAPFLYPMLPAALASYEGLQRGSLFGLVLGVVCDALILGPFDGFYTLLFTLIALFSALIAENLLSPGLLCGLVVSAMALLACAGARMALELLGGNRALFLMLRLLLLETALTLPALAVVLPLYRTVHRRCAADY